MPSLPPANCSSGKSGCFVNTKRASVKKGPHARVREGNMHKQETIKVRATSAWQLFLGFVIINSRGLFSNQSDVSLHQQQRCRNPTVREGAISVGRDVGKNVNHWKVLTQFLCTLPDGRVSARVAPTKIQFDTQRFCKCPLSLCYTL